MKPISNIAELRRVMRRNERPFYFISASPFNLMGIDEWVGNCRFISLIDPFDGRHPNVFVPSKIPGSKLNSIEEINNHLLKHPEVIDYITKRGGKPIAVFLMFDEITEKLCKELGIEIWSPTAKLRQHFDNKIETVRIGNKAGVPSVPNTLARARTYKELRSEAEKAGLGTDLVIQTRFGDSGRTTFFIASEKDYDRYASTISAEAEVKIMKHINCRSATMDACITASGTLVVPLMTEVIGKPELTPDKGGWAGNEIFAKAFSETIRAKARDMTCRLGNQLFEEGYLGYFNVDYLIVEETGEVYLGEINPRISGASSLTNHAPFAYADAPLFLFHLLAFSGIDATLDVEDCNDRWAREESIESWSQMIIKSIDDLSGTVIHAPATGIYRMMPDGSVSYHRSADRWQETESEEEAFFLRLTGAGDPICHGAYHGVLVLRGRVMNDESVLTERARNWIKGIRSLYVSKRRTKIKRDETPEPDR
ncbi:biotin carboxylase (plasmid) [Rhizobium leguminosarum bv. trifolii CB782]|nr:biotin carboxylase [Rhizobium leguminosarum bv. trifolii CB782]